MLYVSYAYPPVGGAGVQRSVKFTKYLPGYGWFPTVLTVANPSVPVLDHDLVDDIGPETTVVRARTWEPSYRLKRWLQPSGDHRSDPQRSIMPESRAGSELSHVSESAARSGSTQTARSVGARIRERAGSVVRGVVRAALHPDPQVLWNGVAFRRAVGVLREGGYHAIVVTGPPFSSFLLGRRLRRRFGLPLVLDFRDEWVLGQRYFENLRGGGWDEARHRRRLRQVLAAADGVVATTEGSRAELERACREVGGDAMTRCITNGFDPDDFRLLPEPPPPRLPYRLVYIGTLWTLTDVTPLVDAVWRLCEHEPDVASDLKLEFVGRRTAAQDAALDRLRGTGVGVRRDDYVPHAEALRRAAVADGLCLLLADRPGAERVVPGKVFEYLALRRPILGIVPAGETRRILDGGAGVALFGPEQTGSIVRWLGDQVRQRRAELTNGVNGVNGAIGSSGSSGTSGTSGSSGSSGTASREFERAVDPGEAARSRHSRVTLTGELAGLLDELVGHRSVSPD